MGIRFDLLSPQTLSGVKGVSNKEIPDQVRDFAGFFFDPGRPIVKTSKPIWPVILIFVFGALFGIGSLIGEIPISETGMVGIGLAIGFGMLFFRLWFSRKSNDSDAKVVMLNRIERGLRDRN
ncbi:MAG: hypothetical protein AAFQ00_07045 [Pseudomonadota bacterium]